MRTKTNPTLLQIATSFQLWQEYADPSGLDSEEQFASRSEAENLQILQGCGFTQIGLGDLYSDDGFLQENVEVEVSAARRGEKPTIRVGTHVVLTEDCEICENVITGPGGWYIVVRTEGGAE